MKDPMKSRDVVPKNVPGVGHAGVRWGRSYRGEGPMKSRDVVPKNVLEVGWGGSYMGGVGWVVYGWGGVGHTGVGCVIQW